ncbi:MAG TPA: flagellar hook capping FlgD N-terminal domain-containing protein, partial [Polyangiaceae bacterium]|nr:flagellar hook capping FlgD N-terminal domain-containing protein [Polyangiaceae bacterium]
MSTTGAIGSSTATEGTSGFGLTTGADKALDRDAFLRLLVEQLKNQDPLKPQDNSQFVAELAQFSNLEQIQGVNERLDLLAIQSRGQSNAQVMSMIGQTVTVKGSMVTIVGNGTGAPVNFSLADKTEQLMVTIKTLSGEEVKTMNVGAHKAGLVQLQWDGRDANGLVQPAGSYSISIKATDATGGSV